MPNPQSIWNITQSSMQKGPPNSQGDGALDRHEDTLILPMNLSRTFPWWRHQMETFSALLAICAGNSPVPGEFPTQRPVMRSFDVYFDLRPNKRLSKQVWGWWFETQSRPLWRNRYAVRHAQRSSPNAKDFCSVGFPIIYT